MALVLESLEKSVFGLERSLQVWEKLGKSGAVDEAVVQALQAGVIQHFEVAYEQCWKFLQRWLRDNARLEDVDHPRTRRDLFRMGAQYKLIADPQKWFLCGEARNLSSHTYDAAKAAEVFRAAQQFAADARLFLERLRAVND